MQYIIGTLKGHKGECRRRLHWTLVNGWLAEGGPIAPTWTQTKYLERFGIDENGFILGHAFLRVGMRLRHAPVLEACLARDRPCTIYSHARRTSGVHSNFSIKISVEFAPCSNV